MSRQKNIMNFFKPLGVKRSLTNGNCSEENSTKKQKLQDSSLINTTKSTATFMGKNSESFAENKEKDPYFSKYLQAKIKLVSKRYPVLHSNIGESWFEALSPEFGKPYFSKLSQFLATERASQTVYPPEEQVWTWTHTCPISQVKVVILGQDPYHNPRQAHGLCFSVPSGVPPPPSLLNMYKELSRDIPGFEAPQHGNLIGWARQGVLLLNACLTVRAHSPNSHKDQGWENLTDAVVKHISDCSKGIVFLLWGAYAQKKAASVDKDMTSHTVLLSLDHVRAKRPYVRTVSKWVQDLSLRGAFIFQRKLILLVLQGRLDNVKEYLSRHRTQCIDVDSGGRKCKERMMSVIAEVQYPFIDDKFVVRDLDSTEELQHFFEETGLKDLYESYVKQLCK